MKKKSKVIDKHNKDQKEQTEKKIKEQTEKKVKES